MCQWIIIYYWYSLNFWMWYTFCKKNNKRQTDQCVLVYMIKKNINWCFRFFFFFGFFIRFRFHFVGRSVQSKSVFIVFPLKSAVWRRHRFLPSDFRNFFLSKPKYSPKSARNELDKKMSVSTRNNRSPRWKTVRSFPGLSHPVVVCSVLITLLVVVRENRVHKTQKCFTARP